MTSDDRDPALQALFSDASEDLISDAFTEQVMLQADRLKRRAIGVRASAALALALLGIPLQDVALELTEVLILTLVAIDNSLVAQLLAPINTVGGLLSLVLLVIRAVHRRLFS